MLTAVVSLLASSAAAQKSDSPADRFEIRIMGGESAAGNLLTATPAFSGGVEGAFRLTPAIALTGHYGYDRLGSVNNSYCYDGCAQYWERDSLHEFGGGLRLSAPNRSRLEPYGAVSAGGARWMTNSGYSSTGYTVGTYTVAPYGSNYSSGMTKFAVTFGAGVQFRLTRRTGINFDVSGVGVMMGVHEIPGWLIRPSVGFYFRL